MRVDGVMNKKFDSSVWTLTQFLGFAEIRGPCSRIPVIPSPEYKTHTPSNKYTPKYLTELYWAGVLLGEGKIRMM